MKYLVLLSCISVVSALPVENKPVCVVGDWGPWQESAPVKAAEAVSYEFKGAKNRDAINKIMEKNMEEKQYMFSQPLAVSASELNLHGSNLCQNGMAGSIPCKNVDQLAFMDFDDLGYDESILVACASSSLGDSCDPKGNDNWGWTDPVTGDEYVLEGVSTGVSFVRITDPYNPVAVGFMYSHTVASHWRDVKVIGNFVFIGSEAFDHGMQIFDMTRLRGRRTLMKNLKPDAHYDWAGRSHNIVANEETGYIYMVGVRNHENQTFTYNDCSGGLHAVDVRNPKSPKFAGCFDEDGYTHDAQCVVYKGPDARYHRHEVCFAFNEDSVTIVDVTDKNNMHMISRVAYEGAAYTHQGWLTADQSVLLLNDEADERGQAVGEEYTRTYVWDVRRLDKPKLKHVHIHDNLCIDHNLYIKDGFTYQANYEAGMRILAIDQKTFSLREVGYFDVYPNQTTPVFAGAWNAYPYFRSGVVAISSIDYGLFLVKPDNRAMEMAAVAASASASSAQSRQTRYREVLFKQEGAFCPGLAESRINN